MIAGIFLALAAANGAAAVYWCRADVRRPRPGTAAAFACSVLAGAACLVIGLRAAGVLS